MIVYKLLAEDDKQALIERIISLDLENEELRKENERLKEQLNKSKPEQKKFYEEQKPPKKSKPPHLWGRKAGHPGCTRPKPNQIDREVNQHLKLCPKCRHGLGHPIGVVEHIQEDIIPSRVEVTRYKRHRYWCSHCSEHVTAPYAADEVPYGYLGPRTLAMMVWLKYYHSLPGNKIKDIFRDFCQLKVSEGAIAQALQRLARYLQVEAVTILNGIRSAAYKHGDETGWKINGIGHWLWTLVNGQWAYFQIHRSRGSKVVKELLGDPFTGVLVTDFYSAYNRIKGIKQKCLIHLRREMRNAKGTDPPDSFLKPYKKLNRILDDALRLAQKRESMSTLLFHRRTRCIKKRLLDFGCASYSNKTWQRLSKRLLKHELEIFTFLDLPGIPSHNNTAERSIRPHVILRNRSFQNRTDKGAHAHGTLTSLMQTLALQKQDGMSSLASAYVQHRQGYEHPILFQSA
jgi:transposase